tara:strand:+ start:2117 stop:3082 length:966 start_codon:yes stop_codon:yes gene_type:complete
MSCSIKCENVIISPPDQGKDEINIRNIDMKNLQEITDELDRLKTVRMKWNIHTPPKPNINFDDYGNEKRKEYQEAKDKFYLDYKTTCQDVNENIKNLQKINTDLCFEVKKEEDDIKIANGTFYSPDEIAHMNEEEKIRKDSRAEAQAKYYENNKKKLKKKTKIKKYKKNIIENEGVDPKMLRDGVMIKPLCQCGKVCSVRDVVSIKDHSVNIKHKLFKSIIKLIHYKRKNKKLKPIIKKINNDYIRYKKVERKFDEEKTYTGVTKKDIDVIKLYKDMLNPFDENITHQPREAYINKVEYTDDYKDNVFEIRLEKLFITSPK